MKEHLQIFVNELVLFLPEVIFLGYIMYIFPFFNERSDIMKEKWLV